MKASYRAAHPTTRFPKTTSVVRYSAVRTSNLATKFRFLVTLLYVFVKIRYMNNIRNMFRQEGYIRCINLLFTAMYTSRNVSYESYSYIVAADICVERDAQLLLSQFRFCGKALTVRHNTCFLMLFFRLLMFTHLVYFHRSFAGVVSAVSLLCSLAFLVPCLYFNGFGRAECYVRLQNSLQFHNVCSVERCNWPIDTQHVTAIDSVLGCLLHEVFHNMG
jgi:hypothetical protein